jgi:hypothetical protein
MTRHDGLIVRATVPKWSQPYVERSRGHSQDRDGQAQTKVDLCRTASPEPSLQFVWYLAWAEVDEAVSLVLQEQP